MSDAVELVKWIKIAAAEAIEAAKPVAVYYGIVESISPVKINVEQKMLLSEAQLIFTKAVTDHEVDIQVSYITGQRAGGGGYALFESHDHDYKGRKKIKIYNGLKAGEKVLLIRVQEGQKFIVLDRLCEHTTEGEWL